MNTPTTTTFKRLTLGQRFVSQHPDTKGLTFRKVSERGAFRVLVEDTLRPGRGQTHKEIAFARSASVTT